ncbi:hypothetical protein KI387_016514, partial [Taxus chinensis]
QASVPSNTPTSAHEKLRKHVVVPKMSKSIGLPFNIVDHLKRTNINFTMWGALTILSQCDLLHEALAQLPCVDPFSQKLCTSINIFQEEEKK